MDFGYYFSDAPRYLTGVAYRDLNGNGRYDQGKGLARVTISVEGNATYTVTSQSGGYAPPLDRTGDVKARAAGGALGSLSMNLSASTAGENVKWDLAWTADGRPPNGAAAAPTATVSVAGDPGQRGFVVSRTGDTDSDLTVSYHVGGGAIGGVDYDTLPGTVTIRAGQTQALIPVRALSAHSKVEVFVDAGAYRVGKGQSKLVLSDL